MWKLKWGYVSMFVCGSFLIATAGQLVGLDVSTTDVLALVTLYMVTDLMMHCDFGGK